MVEGNAKIDTIFRDIRIAFLHGWIAEFEAEPPETLGISCGNSPIFLQSDTPGKLEVTVQNAGGFPILSYQEIFTFSTIYNNIYINDEMTIIHQRNKLLIAIGIVGKEDAVDRATAVANKFFGMVSLRCNGMLTTRLARLWRVTNGVPKPDFRANMNFNGEVFNIEELQRKVRKSFDDCLLRDSLMEKALQYYSSAERIYQIATFENNCQYNPCYGSHQYLVSQLLYFKSCTVIVGDPRDRDFQKKYRNRGVSINTYNRLLEIKFDRNEQDIAHSTHKAMSRDAAFDLAKKARAVAKILISEYIDYLGNNS